MFLDSCNIYRRLYLLYRHEAIISRTFSGQILRISQMYKQSIHNIRYHQIYLQQLNSNVAKKNINGQKSPKKGSASVVRPDKIRTFAGQRMSGPIVAGLKNRDERK